MSCVSVCVWKWLFRKCYLVVGVGWNNSFGLQRDRRDHFSGRKHSQSNYTSTGSWFTCTHTGCAPRTAAPPPRASWRRFSSAAHTTTQVSIIYESALKASALGWSVCPSRYLHGERVRERRNTLQGFVGAAAAASSQWHAGRDEEVVRLPR